MKKRSKTLGIVALSMIGMMILFITVVGIGNYFQRNGQSMIGNVIMLLFPLLTYLAVVLFNKKVNGLKVKDYGFGFKNFLSTSLLGIGLAFGLMVIVLLIANIFFAIQIEFSGLNLEFVKPLLVLIITQLFVGFWEEIYFRGLVFNTLLKNNFGFHLSALISALLFSMSHWSSYDLTETSWTWYIGIVFIGYIMSYIYVYTNSIWPAITLHFFWNFLSTLIDEDENKIGLFEVIDYSEHAKTIDDIAVICLGVFLAIILLLKRKIQNSNRMKQYLHQITTASNI